MYYYMPTRKNHIILRLRHETELLKTLAQSLSKQTAGTDRVQTLEHLITAGTCILHRVDPDIDSSQLIILQDMELYQQMPYIGGDRQKSDAASDAEKKRPFDLARHKQHHKHDAADDDTRT